jgi:1,4-alpha-glucan branching enzyme
VHFTLHAPAARQVSLAGTFNRWNPAACPMTAAGQDGTWHAGLPLAPGRYEYLFVINGAEWTPDPTAPWVDDGFGGRNSLVVVPGEKGP